MRSLAPLLVVALVAGCAYQRLYPGQPRPTSEVSFVVTHPSNLLQIESVDGQGVSDLASRLELLPGRHILRMRVLAPPGSPFHREAPLILTMVAEASHLYRL